MVLVAVMAMTAALLARAADKGQPSEPVLNGIDLEQETVLDLWEAMDEGDLSSRALTRFYMKRIRQVDHCRLGDRGQPS
jgi:hypothetical protein